MSFSFLSLATFLKVLARIEPFPFSFSFLVIYVIRILTLKWNESVSDSPFSEKIHKNKQFLEFEVLMCMPVSKSAC